MLNFLLLLISVLCIADAERFYITRNGACSDCGFRDYKYQWCNLGKADWDYCSTNPGMSTRNERCKNECDFHGYSYLWCYLERGGWDYCSKIEDTSILQFNIYGHTCNNHCDLENGVYVCHDIDGDSVPCSLSEGMTTDGGYCIGTGDKKNFCARHGSWSAWCYSQEPNAPQRNCTAFRTDTDVLNTGRLGSNGSNTCTASDGAQMTRLQSVVYQLRNGRQLVTTIFRENPDPARILRASDTILYDARTVLYKWHNGLPSDRQIGAATEQSNGQIRLDRQPQVYTANFGVYMNWQLQINDRTGSGTTSVSQVLIPESLQGFPEGRNNRDWRRILVAAQHYSLNEGGTVWVVQQTIDRDGTLKCPTRGNN